MPKFVFSTLKEEIRPRGTMLTVQQLDKNMKAKKMVPLKASILPQLEYKPKR